MQPHAQVTTVHTHVADHFSAFFYATEIKKFRMKPGMKLRIHMRFRIGMTHYDYESL
jgi:hypothetical protein